MTYFGFTELQNIGFGMVMWSQCGSLSVRDSTDMTVKKTEKKKKVRSTINCKKTKKQTLVHPLCLVPSGGENISTRQREFMKYESDVQPSMNLSITNIRSLTSII